MSAGDRVVSVMVHLLCVGRGEGSVGDGSDQHFGGGKQERSR